MKKRITASIKIDPDLWKRFKIKCIEEGKKVSDTIEELIKKALEEEPKK